MSRADKIIVAVVSLVLLGALIVGFWLGGSPIALENEKLDGIRLADFTSLNEAIQEYSNTNGNLPASLSDLTLYEKSESNDPSTGKTFDYATTSSSTFNLCTTFSDDSSNETQGTNYYGSGGAKETHTKGYDCISFTVTSSPYVNRTPVVQPPAPVTLPTPQGMPSPSCDFETSQITMKTVAPGVSFGLTGDSSYATATPGGVPETVTSVCLGWLDNISSTAKTYSIFRGYGQYDMPVSEMTKVMVVSSAGRTFVDSDASANPCYAVEVNDGSGHVYTSNDACF